MTVRTIIPKLNAKCQYRKIIGKSVSDFFLGSENSADEQTLQWKNEFIISQDSKKLSFHLKAQKQKLCCGQPTNFMYHFNVVSD